MIILVHFVRKYSLILVLFSIISCSKSNSDSSVNDNNDNTTSLRLMTYNIHHANPPSKTNVIDIDAIAEVIREQNVDLVALQEVDVHTIRSGQDLYQLRL